MNYKTHTAGSLFTGLIVSQNFLQISNPTTLGVFISGAILGGILPDIDKSNSYLGTRTKPVSKVVESVFGHRRLFHAPILYVPLYFFAKPLSNDPLWFTLLTGILVGVLSHLILDTLSGGIPWLYPYKKRYKFPLIKIKTNSMIETILFVALLFVNFSYILNVVFNTLK